MKRSTLMNHDGTELRYAVTDGTDIKPWIALVMPFGLDLKQAGFFFDFFAPRYNVVSWESRLILDESPRTVEKSDFSMDKHVMDLHAVLIACGISKCVLVGYCSGAGIALAAANRYPHLFEKLILAHGEFTLLKDDACSTQFGQEMDSLLSSAAADEKHLQQVFEKLKDGRVDQNTHRPDGLELPFSKPSYLARHALNYLSYKENNFKNLARTITHRTLLMAGGRDAQTNVASARKIKELMANSRLHIDSSADHYELLRPESNAMTAIWNYLRD